MTIDKHGQNAASGRESPRGTLDVLLLGSSRTGNHRGYVTGLAVGLLGVTFLAYAFGIFYHSGGVVFIPYHAAIVGGVAALCAGYGRNGLVAGWGLSYFSLLGMRAEWAMDISPRPLIDRVAYVVQLDGLLALAITGIVVTVAGFTVGAIARRGINTLRTGAREDTETLE